MKEKPTSRDLQAQESRRKLLQTSMELIAREGYHNVTISRICRECGVSVGTFYQYFSSKRDIIMLMDREHSQYLTQMCRIEPGKKALEIYLEYVRKYMEYIAQCGFQSSRSLMQSMLEDEVGDEEAGMDLQRDFFCKLVEYGWQTGEFDPAAMTPQEFFELFTVGVNGVFVGWFYTNGAIDVVEYGCRNLNRLVNLIQKEP